VAGRLVRTLVDRTDAAGPHLVRWNGETDSGERSASGVYFYRITYPDGEVSTKKLTILR
jgi:flagellar hook assembly protein FlgD